MLYTYIYIYKLVYIHRNMHLCDYIVYKLMNPNTTIKVMVRRLGRNRIEL